MALQTIKRVLAIMNLNPSIMLLLIVSLYKLTMLYQFVSFDGASFVQILKGVGDGTVT